MLVSLLFACAAPSADVAPDVGDAFVVFAYAGTSVVPGADVLWVAGDGGEVQARTGDDGKALIDGFSWDDGPGTLTAAWAGHAFSAVGVDQAWLARYSNERGYFPIAFPGPPAEPPPTDELTVTVAGVPDGYVDAVTVHPLGWVDAAKDGSWSFSVPDGVATDVLGFAFRHEDGRLAYTNDVYGLVDVPLDPLTGDSDVVVDFADAVEPDVADVTMAVPDDPLFTSVTPSVEVTSVDSGYATLYGLPTAVSRGGHRERFACAWLPIEPVVWPATGYAFLAQSDDTHREWSKLWTPTWPLDGDTDLSFVAPTIPDLAWRLSDVLSWTGGTDDDGEETYVSLYTGSLDGADVRWTIRADPDAPFTLPPLPDGVSRQDVLGSDELHGGVQSISADPADANVWRYAGAAGITVTR